MPPQQVNVPAPIQPESVKPISFFERKVVLVSVIVIILLGAGAYFVVHQSTNSQLTSNVPTSADINVGAGYFLRDGKIFYYTVSQYVTGVGTSTRSQVNESEVIGADPSMFVVLQTPGTIEAKDAKNLYVQSAAVTLSGSAALTVDISTLNNVAPGIVKDRSAVYTINLIAVYDATKNENVSKAEVIIVQGADPVTFVALADPQYGSVSTYAKDKNTVYFLSGGYNPDVTVTKILGIDPNTFKVIGSCAYPAQPSGPYAHVYNAVDATHVLAGNNIVPLADPSTFKIVGEIPATCDGLGCNPTVYAVDKNNVYKDCSEVVKGATPAQCTADLNKCSN